MTKVHIVKDHKALILPRRDLILNTFPEVKDAGGKYLALPHNLRNTIVLRGLGYEVSNPIEYQYEFPNHKGDKPFASQVATCDLVTSHPRAYVLNDMGTGKTRATLWAWDWLNRQKLAKKVVVFSTLSNLRLTWGSEILSTMPGRTFEILHGTKAQRFERLANPAADLFIVNHDGVGILFDELLGRTDIDTVIVDELAVFRNDSQRSKFMRKLCRPKTWVWGLTGSPMPRHVTDVWGQAKVVTPHTVPKYFSHARAELCVQKAPHLWVPRSDGIERAYSWLQPSIRVALSDVVELPPLINDLDKTPPGTPVELSSEQRRVYEGLSKKMVAMARDRQITAANSAVALDKLVQVAGGWVYTADGGWVCLDPTPRIEKALEIIDEAANKIIVMVPYLHAIEGLAKKLADAHVDYAVVPPSSQAKARDEILVKFQQTSSIRVLVSHPRKISHGLTLTAADTCIWFSPITSYETYEQGNARFRRTGQRNKQRLFHLTGTKAEAHLYSMLNRKQVQQTTFLKMFEEGDL